LKVKDRPLSIQEYKRIQEFPDDYIFCGNTLQKYKQIGNAVPFSLGKAIGKIVISLLQNKEIPIYNDFSYSRYKNTSDKEILN
jgi:DNA (cytosine-5)-methyltransferase 1